MLVEECDIAKPECVAQIGRMVDAAYFLEKAEQSFRLSQVPGLDAAVAEELRGMGHDFMAKAVYYDTLRSRSGQAR